VTQAYGRIMRESGLEVTQLTLLQVLHRAGPLTQGSLGEILAMDSTTLSRSLRPLERKGWIASGYGTDRRRRYWQLKAAGTHELKRVEPLWHKAQARMHQALGETGWKSLMHSADRASEAALSL
jgi:DNA-binding MarR family transcriptional regulator